MRTATFTNWRAGVKLSAKTKNHYLGTIKNFLGWLVKHNRITVSPLRNISPVDTRGKKVNPRRTPTDDEVNALIDVSKKNGIVYFIAARTGMRRGDFQALRWENVRIDQVPARIHFEEGGQKNGKRQHIDLLPEVVEALREFRPADAKPSDRVFPWVSKHNPNHRKDYVAAGIPLKDERGRKVDFHSLRYAFATHLAINGVDIHYAVKLMRHSDSRLLREVYTDYEQVNNVKTLEQLPRLRDGKLLRIVLQKPDFSSPEQSQAVTKSDVKEIVQNTVDETVSRILAHLGANSRLVKMVDGAGLEPATSSV